MKINLLAIFVSVFLISGTNDAGATTRSDSAGLIRFECMETKDLCLRCTWREQYKTALIYRERRGCREIEGGVVECPDRKEPLMCGGKEEAARKEIWGTSK